MKNHAVAKSIGGIAMLVDACIDRLDHEPTLDDVLEQVRMLWEQYLEAQR